MRTIENSNDRAVCFDEKVWKQERQIIYFKHKSGTMQENIVRLSLNSTSNVLATYTLDENNEVEIDVSELIRMLGNTANTLYLWCGHSISSAIPLLIPYTVVGLINPANVLIPRTISGQPIEPPSVMYAQVFDGLANAIRMELCASEYAVFYTVRGTGEGAYQLEPWQPITARHERMTHARFSTESKTTKFAVKQPEACKQYAAVRWVSFTGQTRLHMWEIVQSKTETDGAFELLTQDGAFNVVKGRKDGFALRLDGLNAYDVWYYSDVCHSSSVEVSLDGQTWQRVNVTSKGVTVQDGNAGKTNTLLVELTYKKYDAVSM